ncbi:ACP S-malonyltransferase [Candidatus Woesearchaeota archaeon]|nr:ACP S-malonyltransferase [Candidatus Woesearchaeota archaeon]
MGYSKIALVFPGQGSHYEGMGKGLYDKSKVVRDVYEQAGDILHYNIADICFKEHKLKKLVEKLNRELENRLGIKRHFNIRAPLDKTIYTQPAVLTTSCACYKALEERCNETGIGLKPFLVAGHSLGEYTALTVAGAMDFETSLRLVQKRANYMAEVGNHYPDAKLMLLNNRAGLNHDKIDELCRKHDVFWSLINSQKQVVVGGNKRGLSKLAKELGEDRTVATLMELEGPFHTPLMQKAAENIREEMAKKEGDNYVYPIQLARIPVIANVTAEAIVDPVHVRDELYHQIYKRVNWEGSVEKAVKFGSDLFIEIGPKKVLNGLIRDISPNMTMLNVQDPESLENTVKGLMV